MCVIQRFSSRKILQRFCLNIKRKKTLCVGYGASASCYLYDFVLNVQEL